MARKNTARVESRTVCLVPNTTQQKLWVPGPSYSTKSQEVTVSSGQTQRQWATRTRPGDLGCLLSKHLPPPLPLSLTWQLSKPQVSFRDCLPFSGSKEAPTQFPPTNK